MQDAVVGIPVVDGHLYSCRADQLGDQPRGQSPNDHFEDHKLLLSFLITVQILRNKASHVTPSALRGRFPEPPDGTSALALSPSSR